MTIYDYVIYYYIYDYVIYYDYILHMTIKQLFKPTSKNGETGRFNRSLLTESF